MKMRTKISAKGSKRLFTATAMKTHKKNVAAMHSRGGIRM